MRDISCLCVRDYYEEYGTLFENRVLRKIFGPKTDEVTGNGENYIMMNLMICTAHQILCGKSNREE